MSQNEKPSPVATVAIGDESKVEGGKIEEKAQGHPYEKVIHVKLENPQVASKNSIPAPPFLGPYSRRLCPKGTWKAVCCLCFLGTLLALIFFILDLIRHHDSK
ncbi:hypothetical protein PIB30_027627 [Stylosanthes scabra]|uniref:Uncharacterized protein n=1 Tax=Stylosanthes scabra TaxID=79078 RepID=A0ABU6QAC9_9FABA|nr:hypothetical protein [Stylosanthes scabra]